CGQVVTTDTVLTADIGPCARDGVLLTQDEVTLDLGGHRIFGFPGPADGTAAGVRVVESRRVTVTNGTVSDFDAGVVIGGGGLNTLSGLTVRDNIGPDDPFNSELGDGIILFGSHSNVIVGNTVTHNGIFDGIGILGSASDDNTVSGNVVENTVGPSDGGPAGQGIIVNGAEEMVAGTTIEGTVVSENVVQGNASAGIADINSLDGTVSSNTVLANGFTNAFGNGIGVQLGPGSFGLPEHLLVQGNEVHGNAENGIEVRYGATQNQIVDNDAADNAQKRNRWSVWFDLLDGNPHCDDNVWSGNIAGSGGAFPPCTLGESSASSRSASVGPEPLLLNRRAPGSGP
ncbi:MAG: right-handed parallel beta-helix repeat-containing protein, partial [Actinobacteria bacterium]|nr:right-handed parallel beta-helix repeat-containing protein [Actinomycetota bacterium]